MKKLLTYLCIFPQLIYSLMITTIIIPKLTSSENYSNDVSDHSIITSRIREGRELTRCDTFASEGRELNLRCTCAFVKK